MFFVNIEFSESGTKSSGTLEGEGFPLFIGQKENPSTPGVTVC